MVCVYLYDWIGYDNVRQEWISVKEAFKVLIRTKKTRQGRNVPENFPNELRIHQHVSSYPRESMPAGIVKLEDLWEDNESLYAVMELCNGGDLHDYV